MQFTFRNPPHLDGGSTGVSGTGRTSLAITSGGQPYIGYRSGSVHPSILTRKADGTWQSTILELDTLPGPVIGAPSLAIAPNSQPAASYSTGERGLVYAIMNPFAAP